jgi:deoxyribodipyrimidine photo-lyase
MLAGLKEVEQELKKHNIGFTLTFGGPKKELVELFHKLSPSAVYFDFSPLRGPRSLHEQLAGSIDCPCFVVDTHNIIPVWVASASEEFAAHTFRSKVHAKLADWLEEPSRLKKHPVEHSGIKADWAKAEKTIAKLSANGIKIEFCAGESAAHARLASFQKDGLADYAENRNVPTIDGQSELSPYLHYGMISSLRVALEITKDHTPLLLKAVRLARYEGKPSLQDSIDALLEEMIVRKELSDNFCYYNHKYDSIDGARDWARKSLQEHIRDAREYEYSLKELENARTHDPAWNAAQNQLRKVGKMHGYMRMYWAKKILEWSSDPADAVKHADYLNDHYSIDGGDPNGYVGVLWSVAGLHDRPWFEREVYGKIRYMNYNGLKNKFDVEAYEKKWNA